MVHQQSCAPDWWDIPQVIYMSSHARWWPMRYSRHWRSFNFLYLMLVISSWYLVSRIAVACIFQMYWFLACDADAGDSVAEEESLGIRSTSSGCQCREAVVRITRLPKEWCESIPERTPLNAVWSHTKAQLRSEVFNLFLTIWFKGEKAHHLYG